ncbi:MAG: bifunctional phosphopantothenoylcysteine decarboxylase/phosphopantothenate--cysteine ligase CoaBC [Candidatus Binatia bacterium]|nr:bifunctional phosphopantothenoylcysteine decarboxylase/phosphopantothenate--cysteine ligase CoaBC [Candidatus Binatia bacterium]
MSRCLRDKNILLGLTGGIACYKSAELARLLVREGARVHVLMSAAAQQFITPLTMQSLTGHAVATDLFELSRELQIGHIQLADLADAYVIAPATADVVGKLASGQADDVVTTVALATRAPILVAPSMNVNMFEHPLVQKNLDVLERIGYRIVPPGEGELACGWHGKGRLAEPHVLLAETERAVTPAQLTGERILVTAGPTREFLDPVRFLTNRSSGKMGFQLAAAAWRRGAKVKLITGPVSLATPHGVERRDVVSAEDMFHAVQEEFRAATVLIMCAAVADYRPAERRPTKLKKQSARWSVELEPTVDILASIASSKEQRFVVGFAAETENVEESGRSKLLRKGLDLVVANDVSRPGAGMEADVNSAILLDRFGGRVELPLMSKAELAEAILDRVVELRQQLAAF